MKKTMFAVAIAAALVGGMNAVHAEDDGWAGDMRERVHDAERRIDRGLARGALTEHEGKRLHLELNRILEKIDRANRREYRSRQEEESIDRDFHLLNREITDQKRENADRRRYERY